MMLHAPGRAAVYGLIALLLLAADLAFKYWSFANYPLRAPADIWIPNLLAIQLTYNTGAVFGLGQGYGWVFVMITVIAATLIITTLLRSGQDQWLLHLCLAMIFAGALGNMYDRMVHPGVRDMLLLFPGVDLPFGWTWPGGQPQLYPWIFNLADVYLVIGIIVILIRTIFEPVHHEAEPKQTKPADDPS